MRRFFSFLTIAALVIPAITHAAVNSGDLIKGSGSSVYYFGANGKRYVFPTEKTYFSWYSDFSNVKTVPDDELASYPLGGNVTYKPGVKMVKITTDPRVYAVAKGGTLRWIQGESLAASLYGSDWTKKIDDIPDAFFINYSVGAAIAYASDFTPSTESANAVSINVDKNLSAPSTQTPPPATTSTPPVTTSYTANVSASNQTPTAGSTITAMVNASPSGSLSQIRIFFDNMLQRTCSYTPCGGDIPIPVSLQKSSYELRGEVDWIDAHHATSSILITPQASNANGVTLSITKSEVRPGGTREFVASVDTSFVAKYLDIYVDGIDIHGCNDLQQCRWLDNETSPIGTVHTAYAIAQDAFGNKRQSPSRTFTVVSNDHPVVSVLPAKNGIYQGETVDVTVNATDDDGIAWTEVWLDNTLLKHCAAASCTITTGPWNQARSLQFIGVAQDTLGISASASSSILTVQ